MRILVTGVNGQLGYDVCRELEKRSYNDFKGIDVDDLDITDEAAVRSYIHAFSPDVVVHNAAFTAVDKAEQNSDLCYKVNALGTLYIARACAEIGAKIAYISTDYVFDGKKEGEYFPEDAKCPQSVYGATKSQGEEFVKASTDKYFIVRTSWVFGINGNNFIKTMLRLAESREELNVVCDQKGSPTYTADLAKLLCDMILTEKYGVYHATNEGICSWYEFACEIFRLSGKSVKVNPVTTEQYLKMVAQQAKRPLNSAMNKDKLKLNGFEKLPDWQNALARYLKELTDE